MYEKITQLCTTQWVPEIVNKKEISGFIPGTMDNSNPLKRK